MGKTFDDQFHHLSFSMEEDRLVVLLDGVKIEGKDTELAVKVFEHGIWFKYQPLESIEGMSQKEISDDSIIRTKKGRKRKR
jgi:hypothetical protein